MKAVASILAPAGGKRKQAAVSGGFNNPIVGGGGALVYPSIHSPNFNIANPPASPAQSWAILKSGLAYLFGVVITGGTITGPDYEINSSGAFFSTGTPALGNLAASVVPGTASVTDPSGNTAKPGVTVYDTGGLRADYLQMVAGTPAAFNMGTGDGSELTPGKILSGVQTILGSHRLSIQFVAPTVTGQTGTGAKIEINSATADLTTGTPEVSLATGDNSGNFSDLFVQGGTWQADAGNAASASQILMAGTAITLNATGSAPALAVAIIGTASVSGQVTATGGTAASPTKVLTDTWQQVSAFVNGWSSGGHLDYRLAADDTIEVNGRITNVAGTAGNSRVTTLAPGYAPANRIEFFAAIDTNGTAHSVQLDTSGQLQVNTAVAAGGTVTLAARVPRSAPA